MFGNMIRHSEFWGSGFICEDLILPYFCLQMGNDNMLKSNDELCLKYEYQLKQKNIRRENVAAVKKMDFLKNGFAVSKTQIQPFMNDSINFDIKCEHFGVKRLMRLFRNK